MKHLRCRESPDSWLTTLDGARGMGSRVTRNLYTMKAKYVLIIGVLGMTGVILGAFFKIQHYPGGSGILGVSVILELIAGLMIIWKLISYKGQGDFLNS